jgi:hypothetical protein
VAKAGPETRRGGIVEHPDDFAKAFEAAFARLQVGTLEACGDANGWPHKVAAGVRAGLEFAVADPVAAQLLTNEALARGADGIGRYERLIAYFAERLLPGRELGADGERLPGITERAMAAGVVMTAAQAVDQGRASELSALAPEAIQFVLTPYLGSAEARRIGAEYGKEG